MPAYRSRTSTHGRNMAGARGLWRATGMKDADFGKPIIANADAIMLKELRRIGGLVKHVHNQSNGAYNTETISALSTLKKYIEKLTAK